MASPMKFLGQMLQPIELIPEADIINIELTVGAYYIYYLLYRHILIMFIKVCMSNQFSKVPKKFK